MLNKVEQSEIPTKVGVKSQLLSGKKLNQLSALAVIAAMKAHNLFKINVLFMCLLTLVLLGSCKKLEPGVIENNYSGAVLVTSSGSNPAGDFTGDGDSGTYSFAFDNPKTKVQVNFDITTPTGSVRIVIEDKKGKTVLDQTLSGGSGTDTFSGLSSEGKKGVWKVTLTLTNFDGDGSYSINPA